MRIEFLFLSQHPLSTRAQRKTCKYQMSWMIPMFIPFPSCGSLLTNLIEGKLIQIYTFNWMQILALTVNKVAILSILITFKLEKNVKSLWLILFWLTGFRDKTLKVILVISIFTSKVWFQYRHLGNLKHMFVNLLLHFNPSQILMKLWSSYKVIMFTDRTMINVRHKAISWRETKIWLI